MRREILKELQNFATKQLLIDGYNLDRVKGFLNFIGNPQDNYDVIHITGTAGKGSTTSHLSRILSTHGLKVGISISPHINTPQERIQINNQMISEDDFIKYFELIKNKHDKYFENKEGLTLTYFEFLIVMGFQYFSDNSVDVLVLEVGLGGRIDPTNVVHSQIQIITSIGLDHVRFLGNSLEEIAADKSGIIKEKGTVILGDIDSSPKQIIRQRATEFSSNIYEYENDFSCEILKVSKDGTSFRIVTPIGTEDLNLKAIGEHQAVNASIAIFAAIKYLQTTFNWIKTKEGLRKSYIPGRFEYIAGEPDIIFDTAHNYMKISSTVNAIKQVVPTKKLILLLAFKKDKDPRELLSPLERIANQIDRVILTKYKVTQDLTNYSEDIINFSSYLSGILPLAKVEAIFPSKAAFLRAKDYALAKGEILLVTGSFYLIDSLNIPDSNKS